MRIKLRSLLLILIVFVLFVSSFTFLRAYPIRAEVFDNGKDVALNLLKEQSVIDPKFLNFTVDSPCEYSDKFLNKHFVVYAIKKYDSIIGRIVLLKTEGK